MSRRKIRNFVSKEEFERRINNFIKENKDVIINELLEKTNTLNTEELSTLENNLQFGFDCGIVYFTPLNERMKKEWQLDNNKYDFEIWPNYPFECQSTTLQKIQAKTIIKLMNLSEVFYTRTWLD